MAVFTIRIRRDIRGQNRYLKLEKQQMTYWCFILPLIFSMLGIVMQTGSFPINNQKPYTFTRIFFIYMYEKHHPYFSEITDFWSILLSKSPKIKPCEWFMFISESTKHKLRMCSRIILINLTFLFLNPFVAGSQT